MWPFSDADATSRIQSQQIREGMKLGIAAFTATAEAMRQVVTRSMPRGEVSTQVSKLVPRSLTYDCRSCGARHIAGNVWQHSGLPGGVQVESRGKDATLGPIKDWPGVPDSNEGIDGLIRLYLRLLGPGTPADVAKYFGSAPSEIKKVWPDDLVEVTVDGRRTWLPKASLSDLKAAKVTPGVRLLPAMDALLQARDRDVLVPGRDQQKEVWRALGNPGVVLVDSEIVGVWRGKMAGRKRIDLTVTPFEPLSAKVRKAVGDEADQVARARGAEESAVAFG